MSELKLYPITECESIGSIDLKNASKQEVHMIIILDKSGSMGYQAGRMVNEIFPTFLAKLAYQPNNVGTLISFSSRSERHNVTVAEMTNFPIQGYGGTNMTPAILELQSQLMELSDPKIPIRLLTVSDGEIFDPDEVKKAAAELVHNLSANGNLTINSQAVRLFTSNQQPDTTALCSLIQLNNVTKPQLVDISVSEDNEEIATKIAELFMDDKLSTGCQLAFDNDVVKKYPWDPNSSSNINLVSGNNVFWVSSDAANATPKIDNKPANVAPQVPVTLETFNELVKEELINIGSQMKIQKVIGTEESRMKTEKILKYFEETEQFLESERRSTESTISVKKISTTLKKIAGDDSVYKMNELERAEYLRNNEDTDDFNDQEEYSLRLFRLGKEEKWIGSLNFSVAKSNNDANSNSKYGSTSISVKAHQYLEEILKGFLTRMPKEQN